MSSLSDAIKQNAEQGLKSVSQDGRTATAHDLQQQIAADQYLREVAQSKSKRPGIRYVRFKAGGNT
jgi:hypothetical protein